MSDPPLDPNDSLPVEEWMVCSTCGRMLEKYDEMDVRTGRVVSYVWRHPFDVLEKGEDHAPVPVMRKDMDPAAIAERCDFCLQPYPQWLLPVENFQEPFGVTNHETGRQDYLISHSDWTACDECGELLRKGYWDRLTKRALKAMKDRHGLQQLPEVTTLFIKLLYREISRHTTGPLRPRGDVRKWSS